MQFSKIYFLLRFLMFHRYEKETQKLLNFKREIKIINEKHWIEISFAKINIFDFIIFPIIFER